MHRPPSILASALALAALAGPTAALAQTFPASAAVAASMHSLGPDTRAFIRLDRDAAAQWRAPATTPPTALTSHPQPLKLQSRIALGTADAPLGEIRAKDAWSDDQGLRASPTKVSFKQRF